MSEHHSPADMQHPFTIRRKTNTADGAGGYTAVEAQVGSTHYCHFRPLRGDERTVNEGLTSTGEVLLVTWSAVDIRVDDTIDLYSRRYNVRSIAPHGMSQFQEVTMESGVVT